MKAITEVSGCNWEERAVKAIIPRENRTVTVEQKNLFLEFLDEMSEGGGVKRFLVSHTMTWAAINSIAMSLEKGVEWMTMARNIGYGVRYSLAEDEAFRRAVEGVDKPVFQGGQRVGFIKQYSDNLLAVVLKAENPDKYSEKHKVEHDGTVMQINIHGIVRDK